MKNKIKLAIVKFYRTEKMACHSVHEGNVTLYLCSPPYSDSHWYYIIAIFESTAHCRSSDYCILKQLDLPVEFGMQYGESCFSPESDIAENHFSTRDIKSKRVIKIMKKIEYIYDLFRSSTPSEIYYIKLFTNHRKLGAYLVAKTI